MAYDSPHLSAHCWESCSLAWSGGGFAPVVPTLSSLSFRPSLSLRPLSLRPLSFRPLSFRPLSFRPLSFRPLSFRRRTAEESAIPRHQRSGILSTSWQASLGRASRSVQTADEAVATEIPPPRSASE